MDTIENINECRNPLTSTSKRIKTSRKFQELAAELMTINGEAFLRRLLHKLDQANFDLIRVTCRYCVVDKTNALKLYNRSIAVSPINFIDLPIAYANKSAVLLEMKNYYSCLRNINFALKHPLCPLWIISALLERRVKCLLLMGRWNEHTEKKLFRAIKRLPFSNNEKSLLKVRLNQYLIHVYELIKNTEDRKFKIDKYADTYKKPKRSAHANGNILHFSERIQIVQNSKYGRHIVAKNDINMGDLLVKEKAVISCLYSSEVYDYCSCCSIRTQVLIPCQHCSRTLFCSKHCLNAANNQYHRVECSLMEFFATLEPEDQHIQYVLRLLCFLSNQGKNLTEFVDKWKEWKSKDKTYPNKTKIYDLPDDLPTLFLSYDRYVREPLQQVRSQSRFSKLVQMLRNKTDFFARADSNAYEAYFDYTITSLLVDLEACLKCNSFCVSDSIHSNNKLTITRKNIGLACYRKTNFYNHSCVPNVAYCFENGDTIATYSLRNIQAGEQLCICYLRTYYEADLSERDLLKSYSFQCRCVACRENWPPFEYLQSIYDTRFCECEHHDALSRRVSITGCSFCRFKRDLAASLKTVRDRLTSNMPFDNVIENLRLDIVEAMDLFQSLAGIEVHLMKEYVELYRLYGRCIEFAGSGSVAPS